MKAPVQLTRRNEKDTTAVTHRNIAVGFIVARTESVPEKTCLCLGDGSAVAYPFLQGIIHDTLR